MSTLTIVKRRASPRRPTYYAETKQGRRAFQAGRWRDACPFGNGELGRRMAWLAGWEDAFSEAGYDRR